MENGGYINMKEDINYWWIGAENLPEDGTYMFRYSNGSPNLDLEAFKVVKETPKGRKYPCCEWERL
jgi:hypothetical protein